MKVCAFYLIFIAVPAFAGESVLLSSGMRLHVDRHDESGAVVRLYRGASITELPKTSVRAFEPDEPVPPVVAAVQAPPVVVEPPPATPPTTDPRTLVREAAVRSGLPAAFVESVAKTESGFNPAAVSPKGAIGVMQLMPATAKSMGVDPNNPEQNIDAGARLLRELLLKYGGDVVKALAAYNAGESAVDRYQGVPPFPETQHYVNTVVNSYLKSTGQ